MLSYIREFKHKIKNSTLSEMLKEAKWMLRYTKKYWKAVILIMLFGVMGTGMGLLGSVTSKYLIDAVTGHNSRNLIAIISIIILMALGGIASKAASSRILTRISLKATNEMQAEIFDKIMNTDWEALSDYHSGDLLNRFSQDVSTVTGSVLGWLPNLIINLLQFIGTLAIILYFDAAMALIALLSAPVTMIISRMCMVRMRNYNKKMRQISSEMMSFNEEAFQNIQTIKCFDLIKYFGQRLRGIQKTYMDLSMEYNKFNIYVTSFLSVVGTAVAYATFGWGVYRLWSGYITFGTLTLFLQLSNSLSGNFTSLVGMIPSAISATTSAGRIMAVAELPRERKEDEVSAAALEPDRSYQGLSIQLTNMSFRYKNRDIILQNADMHAKPKEIIAVVGKSGEGKTTLLKLLLGLLNPTGGEAKIIDLFGSDRKISNVTRGFFSYVPQGNTIFSGTIADNLRMVKPDATGEELITALKASCAYDFVVKLPEGILSRVGEKGMGLSEGQAQRLAIARAVLRNAPIMLLDEATSALDAATEQKVIKSIMAYGKVHTCIVTTHKRSIIDICDRVYQINDARISEV